MIKKIGYIFVLLILIALGGSGWFFSGVIYEGALNPEFNDSQSIGTAEDRVIVSKVNSNSIILNVEEEKSWQLTIAMQFLSKLAPKEKLR